MLEIKKDWLDRIEKLGCIEVEDGIYLWTAEDIMAEQKSWNDEDACKQDDFSTHKYWITTDGGCDPEGFDNIEECINQVKNK